MNLMHILIGMDIVAVLLFLFFIWYEFSSKDKYVGASFIGVAIFSLCPAAILLISSSVGWATMYFYRNNLTLQTLATFGTLAILLIIFAGIFGPKNN